MKNQRILVTGATGTVGRVLLSRLRGSGADLRVLVRDAARLPDRSGLEVMVGDLADRERVAAATRGVDALFLLTKPTPLQGSIEAGLIQAARAGGVRRVVRLSVMNADPAAGDTVTGWHGSADRALRDSGLGWVLLQPNFFMQNFLGFARAIAGRGGFALPTPGPGISLVDVRDIAAVAATALLDPEAGGCRAIEVTGPETLGFDDVAAILSERLARPVTWAPLPVEQLKAKLQPAWYAEAIGALWRDFAAGRNARLASVPEPTGFARFVEDHRAAFAAAA